MLQILVVATCDEDTVADLLASTAFAPYQITEDGAWPKEVVTALVHRLPTSVYNSEPYRSWMGRFGTSTQVSHPRSRVTVT